MCCYAKVTSPSTEITHTSQMKSVMYVLPFTSPTITRTQSSSLWMGQCQRGNASLCVCACVTLATLANCHHQSEQRTLKYLHRDLQRLVWDTWQPFVISEKLRIDLLLFLFSRWIFIFNGNVRIYDGELKWWGRKSCWCLSKYHNCTHLCWLVEPLTWSVLTSSIKSRC